MFRRSGLYSLRKSRQILTTSYNWYKKNRKELPSSELSSFETLLQHLDGAILKKGREDASHYAHQVEEFCDIRFKKGIGAYLYEMIVAIVIALAVATVVRQMWFELYEIPTGSMRPTFKEQDHLTVTKTPFGINVPLATRHFYFDPHLVQRTSVVIWSGDGISHLDSDSTFLGIFPYTKRYIKRCLGKPGDSLYFYGGKIYGFDSEGNDLVELRNNPWMQYLDNIPFTNFEGRRSYVENSQNLSPQAIFHHFNQAIGRIKFNHQKTKGEIFNGHTWLEDNPEAQRKNHDTIQTYSDFWGIRNFAIARLLDKDQLESLTVFRAKDLEDALLYLEIRHTPSLNYPPPLLSEQIGVSIKGYSTIIPLQERHLKALMRNMYTCRFVVKNGRASSYRLGKEKFYSSSPSFPLVSDGTYEFYYGIGKKIGWGGIATDLPIEHPLYKSTPKNIQKLFNIGIEMSTLVEPNNRNQPFFPNRYVYFRDGDLYALGGLLMEKNDSILKNFNVREEKREELSSSKSPYVAFKDYGPPLNSEGQLDKEFIRVFGYKIPENHYLMLGDNHAMSQDSRYFGPIPQANLQGAPSLIIWPPGDRWGTPNQKPYALFVFPRLIVWGIVASIALIWYLIHRYRMKKPIFKKLP